MRQLVAFFLALFLIPGSSVSEMQARSNLRLQQSLNQIPSPSQWLYPIPASQSDDQCFGLSSKVCQVCGPTEKNNCDANTATCLASLCKLCTSYTWDCKFSSNDGFYPLSKSASKALCKEIKVNACINSFTCCGAEDEFLDKIIEDEVYADDLLIPAIPIKSCLHDMTDDTIENISCTQCKSDINLKVMTTPKNCDLIPDVVPGTLIYDFNGSPSSTSLKNRCLAMTEQINLKIADVMPDIRNKVCECMGCCKPQDGSKICYFPLQYEFPKSS